jgi:hypothetical protein
MYQLEKLILGTFAHFVEDGTSYGSPANTSGIALYPNADTYPAAWNSMGCVLDSTAEVVEESYEDDCPNPSGGYSRETDMQVMQDILKLSLRAHSEPIHRLVWGAAAPIVNATAFTPFAKKDRFVKGWMHFQLRGQDGEDRVVAAIYGKLRLDAAPKWAKDPTKPAVKFEIVTSTIQTVLPGVINPA